MLHQTADNSTSLLENNGRSGSSNDNLKFDGPVDLNAVSCRNRFVKWNLGRGRKCCGSSDSIIFSRTNGRSPESWSSF
ncbi:hypothetical protein GQ457_05G002620 [Hibiscus cannabinus]